MFSIKSSYVCKLLVVFFFATIAAFSQSPPKQYFPVVAKFTQTAPYPIYLNDFSNPAQKNLSIQMQLRDNDVAGRPFRLKIYIEGQGFLITSTDQVSGESPITLNAGQVFNIPTSQVANYFESYNLKVSPQQYSQPFNAGRFRFGVEVIDFATNRPLSGVQWGNYVWITVNEPPLWITPKDAQFMKPVKPQNINFQWAPRHKSVSNVEYEFVITDLLVNDGFKGNIQNLFLAQPPYHTVTTRANTVNYNATMPPLIPGRTYAYRVQAIAIKGFEDVGVFRNNGYSPIQYFTYGEKLKPPTNLNAAWNKDNASVNFSWKGEPEHKKFEVAYRAGKKDPWVKKYVNASTGKPLNSITLTGLDNQKPYKIQVTGIAADNRRSADNTQLNKLNAEDLLKNEKKFSLSGNVKWAFQESEVSFKDESTFVTTEKIVRRNKTIDTKPQNSQTTYALAQASVTLYYSESGTTVTEKNFKENLSKLKRLEVVSSGKAGEFEFSGLKFALVKQKGNFYVHVKYTNKAFGEHFTPVAVNLSGKINQRLKDIVLTANSLRYKPLLKLPTSVVEKDIERISIYRLQKVVGANDFLKHEGQSENQTIPYNRNTYQRVATLKGNNTFTKLFYNDLFNDGFVIGVKHKVHKEQFFPVSAIKNMPSTGTGTLLIEESFNYVPPLVAISGRVARGTTDKNTPLGEQEVQFVVSPKTSTVTKSSSYRTANKTAANTNGQVLKAKTDASGNYKILIPANVPIGNILGSVKKGASKDTALLAYKGANLKQDFLLKNTGITIVGTLINSAKDPLKGVLVQHSSGAKTKTDTRGLFMLHIAGEATGTLFINADDYQSKRVSVADFEQSKLTQADNATEWVSIIEKSAPTKSISTTDAKEKYRLGFSQRGLIAATVYEKSAVVLEDLKRIISIKAYVKEGSKKKYVTVKLNVNGASINTNPSAAVTIQSAAKSFSIKATGTTQAIRYTYKKLSTIKLPTTLSKKDTFKISVLLKKSLIYAGKVTDSTSKKPIAGVSIKVAESGAAATSAKDGSFKIRINADGNNSLTFSNKKYNSRKELIKAADVEKKKNVSLALIPKKVPKIETLLGFKVELDKVKPAGNKQYLITGKLIIPDSGIITSKKKLSFEDARVTVKEKNALPASRDGIEFEETSIEGKLFEFAEIEAAMNPGEDKLKLVAIKGNINNGQIMADGITLQEEQIMGMPAASNFGEISLKPKGEKGGKMKFNNALDKKTQKNVDKKNAKINANAAKKAKAAAVKAILANVAKSAKNGNPKTTAEKTAKAEGGGKEDEEDPIAIFTPKGIALPLLSKTTAFKVEFGNEKTKTLGTKKTTDSKGKTKRSLTSKTTSTSDSSYFSFNVGIANIPVGVVNAERESAELSEDGMKLEGTFTFPLMQRLKVQKPPKLNELLIKGENFTMKKASFSKASDSAIVNIGVQNKWLLAVKSLEIHENFKGYGLGGNLFSDSTNYMIINSFNVIKYAGLSYPVPGIELSFPEKGFKVKRLLLKSPEDQTIKFGYVKEDDGYEVDGGLIMELANTKKGSVASKVFPLTVQRFVLGKDKFFLAIKADLNLKVGPAKINVRRLMFQKGAAVSWGEMGGYLSKSQAEIDKLMKTASFNKRNANALAVKDKAAKRKERLSGVNATNTKFSSEDITLDEADVKWAFGFAGGIQFEKLKGLKAKVDASFILGDKGSGTEIDFNEIDIVIQSTAFRAAAQFKIVNEEDKVGFEGSGSLEAATLKFEAGLKFYKLKGGIEFGAKLVGSAMVPMDPIVWTSLGGEIDFNTVQSKFMVGFLGSFVSTGTPPAVSEFRKVSLAVFFDGKKCGVLPVIKGSTDWYLKNEEFCQIRTVFDFCRLTILGDIRCKKAVIKDVEVDLRATVFVTKKSLFLGASIKAEVMGFDANGTLQIGVNNNFSTAPQAVKSYKELLPDFMLTNNTLSGVYIGIHASKKVSTSGSFSIWKFNACTYSHEAAFLGKAHLGYNYSTSTFLASLQLAGKIESKVAVATFRLNGEADLKLGLAGGYSNAKGWYANGTAKAKIKVYSNGGKKLSCGKTKTLYSRKSGSIPCGVKCCCGKVWRPRSPRCRVK
jgi:hypothetical protein